MRAVWKVLARRLSVNLVAFFATDLPDNFHPAGIPVIKARCIGVCIKSNRAREQYCGGGMGSVPSQHLRHTAVVPPLGRGVIVSTPSCSAARDQIADSLMSERQHSSKLSLCKLASSPDP